jgi:5-methylcytosine-specific restriction endonuclease McrA
MIPIRQHYTDELKSIYLELTYNLLNGTPEKEFLEWILKRWCPAFTLKDLLVGEIKTLRIIKDKINECNKFKHSKGIEKGKKDQINKWRKERSRNQIKNKLLVKYEYLRNKELDYKSSSGVNINTFVDIIQLIGITVCPYCNRTFIHTTERKESKKTTCQIDHFFEKSKYPYLCLSLFNLIPVCSSCNHSKQSEKFGKSPFEIVDVDNGFKFSLEYDKADYTKLDSFKVVTETPDKELDAQRETLGLDTLYAKHNDIGHELFLKHYIYSEDRIKELCESFPDLFTSPNEVRQLVLGSYIDKKDVGKRPLAKMTRDIMLQLDFIKKE